MRTSRAGEWGTVLSIPAMEVISSEPLGPFMTLDNHVQFGHGTPISRLAVILVVTDAVSNASFRQTFFLCLKSRPSKMYHTGCVVFQQPYVDKGRHDTFHGRHGSVMGTVSQCSVTP